MSVCSLLISMMLRNATQSEVQRISTAKRQFGEATKQAAETQVRNSNLFAERQKAENTENGRADAKDDVDHLIRATKRRNFLHANICHQQIGEE